MSAETVLIECAKAYARANQVPERVGVGLFLAAMALAAELPPDLLRTIAAEYRVAFPDSGPTLRLWAVSIIVEVVG